MPENIYIRALLMAAGFAIVAGVVYLVVSKSLKKE